MKARDWINLGLVLLMLATRDLFKYVGWHVPYLVHFLAGLFAIYLVFDFIGVWDWLRQATHASDSHVNKCEPNKELATPTTPIEKALYLLLIPYYIVIFLLWHYHEN
jgi:hypothetical protein